MKWKQDHLFKKIRKDIKLNLGKDLEKSDLDGAWENFLGFFFDPEKIEGFLFEGRFWTKRSCPVKWVIIWRNGRTEIKIRMAWKDNREEKEFTYEVERSIY